MQHFTIRLCEEIHPACCPACGQHHHGPKGPRLFLESHADPLCRGCGKRMAPAMAALVELAHTAERVGQRSRHLLTPPMESLLDLARAAENYFDTAPRRCVRAG
jgi:hypothetical protein